MKQMKDELIFLHLTQIYIKITSFKSSYCTVMKKKKIIATDSLNFSSGDKFKKSILRDKNVGGPVVPTGHKA